MGLYGTQNCLGQSKVKHSSYFSHSNSCSPENGRIRAVRFRLKIWWAIFFSIWANSVHCPAKNLLIWGKFAQIGQILPEIFWGEIQLRGFVHFEQVSPQKKLLCSTNKFKVRFIKKIGVSYSPVLPYILIALRKSFQNVKIG
jgi:hypothetical protein